MVFIHFKTVGRSAESGNYEAFIVVQYYQFQLIQPLILTNKHDMVTFTTSSCINSQLILAALQKNTTWSVLHDFYDFFSLQKTLQNMDNKLNLWQNTIWLVQKFTQALKILCNCWSRWLWHFACLAGGGGAKKREENRPRNICFKILYIGQVRGAKESGYANPLCEQYEFWKSGWVFEGGRVTLETFFMFMDFTILYSLLWRKQYGLLIMTKFKKVILSTRT